MAKTVTVKLTEIPGTRNIRTGQPLNITLGGAPGIQGQQGPQGDPGQPSNRYAFVLDTTASLNPPYFPRVSASFNGEDLAVSYLTTLGTGSATPYKIISELKPADQSVNINKITLANNGVYISRINDSYARKSTLIRFEIPQDWNGNFNTLNVSYPTNDLNISVTNFEVPNTEYVAVATITGDLAGKYVKMIPLPFNYLDGYNNYEYVINGSVFYNPLAIYFLQFTEPINTYFLSMIFTDPVVFYVHIEEC